MLLGAIRTADIVRIVRTCAVAALLAAALPLAADDVPLEGFDVDREGGGPLPALSEAPAPSLRLLLFDPTKALSADTTAAMGHELRVIFRALSVDVAFAVADADATFGEGGVPEIPVIVLPADPVRSRQKKRVLGLVMREQKPERAIWAFLDNIRWTLGHSSQSRLAAGAVAVETGIGKALGRVVAHEVFHAIAPDEPHTRQGLMNHSLDRGFLLGERAVLDQRCSEVFLARLASRAAAQARAGSTPAPPDTVAAAR
jgi:hypothetical protein